MKRGWIAVAAALLAPALAAQNRSIDPIPARGEDGAVLVPGLAEQGESYNFGAYWALLIGIDRYRAPLPQLENAVNDVESLASLLSEHYGFDRQRMTVLENEDATRGRILGELERLARQVDRARRGGTPQNVLIYYAGHGFEKQWVFGGEEWTEGFWIPYQSEGADNPENAWWDWLSVETVKRATERIPAKHLLIVSDSCFAGGLTRDPGLGLKVSTAEVSNWIRTCAENPSKHVFTSSDREEALDSGRRRGNSVFARHLLAHLEVNRQRCLPASALALDVMAALQNDTDSQGQNPVFSRHPLATSGPGQFVFVRTTGDLQAAGRPRQVPGFPIGFHAPEDVRAEPVEDREGEWRYFADENGRDVEMILVPRGGFVDDEGRKWEVGPFLIDRFEVTNERFHRWYSATGQSFDLPEDEALRHPQQPISGISAAMAEQFARWSRKRLPTEAEWSYAAGCSVHPRSGARPKRLRRYPWGDDAAAEELAASPGLPAVGALPADRSLFGVEGTGGGVSELCLPGNDPSPNGVERVVRGGSHIADLYVARSASFEIAQRRTIRVSSLPPAGTVGFRCVKPLVRYGRR